MFLSKSVFAGVLAMVSGFSISPVSAGELPERYVITGSDLSMIRKKVVLHGGAIDRDLSYHAGFVARMPDVAAEKIAAESGSRIRIEKDGVANVLGRPLEAGKPSGSSVQPAQSIPWGIRATRARDAHVYARGYGVTVCVVDTGVQRDHPDLSANVAGGENFVVIKGVVNPNSWTDDNGHGTHVSGTIAALDNSIGVVGVAPEAKIFAVKALNRQGSGYLSDIADGVRSCVAHGAKVINMSLGGSSDSSLLHQAIIDARNAGVLVVVAAGNESGAVSYPARYPESLAISAVNSALDFASFSNFGLEVDFAAPGVSVLSTVKGSTYASYSGTSMAAPHVAGVAALMIGGGGVSLLAVDIGLPAAQQGQGLIDALSSVLSR